MSAFDPFVGLPWRDRGRDRDGCDCWGLGTILYRELLGVEIESYADHYTNTADREALSALIGAARQAWTEIDCGRERPFDAVLMRERPWHIGWVERPGWMLHMPAEQTSVIEPYTTGRHAPRVVGIYRHASRE